MNSKFLVIIFLIFTIQAFPQHDLKIISSDRNSLVIEYTPSYSDTSVVNINGQNYINLKLRFGFVSNPGKWGEPAVPQRIINIGVPSETGNTIQILNSTYKIISGSIAPKPKLVKKGKMPSFAFEIGKDYSNYTSSKDIVSFGIYGLMRSVPVQSLILSPVEYNPGSRSIKMYTKILFQINFSSNQTVSSLPASDLLNGALVNYDVAKFWGSRVDRKLQKKTVINSVLATGTWVRFEAPTEGIYKITKSMLPSYGIDPNTVDPRTIKIYNNGGKVLPEDLTAPRPSDLVENAIIVVGEDDGKFDDSDYILFYGRGNDFWDYDSASGSYKRFYHPYSNQNYFWITSGGSRGKRMVDQPSVNSPSAYMQNSTTSFVQWDVDEVNIGKSGREYYGDNFTPDITSRTYINKLNGRIDSYPIQYNIRFINASPGSVGLEVDENSTPIVNQILYGYGSPDNYQIGYAFSYTASYNGILPDDRSVLKFNFNPSDVTSVGYLDYFEITYQQQLQAVNDNLLFFSKDTTSVIQYNLSGFSSNNIKIFNISDYSNAKLITNQTFQNAGQCTFQANETAKNVSRYFAVGNDNFLTPSNSVQMSNSNLHGIQTGAKYIIITNKIFDDAAQRLKTYKETQAPEKISTIVVNVDQIFNEFSCGMLDPTAIRDFLAYAYNNWQIKPEYVLFFGKGTYDPKDVEGSHNDFVPAYETQESLDELNSYTMDDYFVDVSGNDPIIDLAYGRITVETPLDADIAVSKIIQYETNSGKGSWRNLITLVADGGWAGGQDWQGTEHTAPSEFLANSIIPKSYDLNKIYLAAYPLILTSLGRRIPDANTAIINAINEGTLIMNYIGHGSPELWSNEYVFVKSTTIPQLHNDKYFFLCAATCDFGYWDIPNFQSATEEMVLQQNAGCIAAFTSARLVESTSNHELNNQLFEDLLLSPRDTSNLPITIGQAAFQTKQTFYDVNSQKYEIIGDPTIRLAIPEYNATIDSINGNNLSSPIQIKALSTVKINGDVKKPDGSSWNDFNGSGILTMYDSQREYILTQLDNYQITLPGGIIFRGLISVTNGKFSSSFIVPKDISYENQNGKIILYFYNNSADGLAYTNNIIVGGTDTNVVNNNIGPDIKIFFDDTTSSNAALVNPNSTLIVKLYDSNGLNTTGTGVGHKLEGILNGQDNNPIDFTNYFTGYLDSGGKSGQINYTLNNLSSGNYSLKVIAWDVFNNYSSKTVNFTVVGGNGLIIQDVYNYPDPFAYNTTFTFQQNLDLPVNVKVKVFTVAGRLVREIEKQGISNKFVKVDWDGRDQNGDLLANGTYLYKIIVNTIDGQYNQSVLGKMAIIR